MKANSLPKGTSITGSNCVIADDGKITKRVSFTEISEYFRDEFSGGGGETSCWYSQEQELTAQQQFQ